MRRFRCGRNFAESSYMGFNSIDREIDGGRHDTEQGRAQDSGRDAFLNDIGLRVLRFSNIDVLGNIDGVIAEIIRHLEKALAESKTKSPRPPFSKGENRNPHPTLNGRQSTRADIRLAKAQVELADRQRRAGGILRPAWVSDFRAAISSPMCGISDRTTNPVGP